MNRIPAVASRNMNTSNENAVTKSKGLLGKAATKTKALTNITNQRTTQTRAGKAAKPEKTKSKRTSGTIEPKPENEPKIKVVVVDPMMVDEEIDSVHADSTNSMDTMEPEVPAWDDIDAVDHDDPQAVVVYVNDIYNFMMEKEKANKLGSSFLANQTEVNEKMRAILVDWLVEVHHMFKLLPETLFLTVFIIDRYLEKSVVSREKLQLVGITAMFIAAKYEEIYAPECNDFVHVSDGAYEKDQILETEQTVLNTLEFNLTCPSALHFLRRYSKAAGSDYNVHTLCKYLIELVLVDIKMVKFLPSEIASGAVYVARAMTQKTPLWTPTLHHYSSYSEEHVRGIALEINNLLKKAQKSSLRAVQKKYASEKYAEVANIPLVDF